MVFWEETEMIENSPISVLITKLKSRKSLPELSPDHIWHPALDHEIAAIPEEQLADGRPDGLLSAQAWKAALHLWNDSLDAAHELVEHMDTPTGTALHGIMHRRERDFDNAKYWLRLAGDHPAFHSLQSRTASFLQQQIFPAGPLRDVFSNMATQGSWNPYLFISAIAIQENRIGDDAARALLENIQQLELEAVIRYLEGRIAVYSEI
jgi:hypothetical protein